MAVINQVGDIANPIVGVVAEDEAERLSVESLRDGARRSERIILTCPQDCVLLVCTLAEKCLATTRVYEFYEQPANVMSRVIVHR
jgi:hypothetical protein